MVLKRLQDAGLQCDIKKCKFYASEVIYLNLIRKNVKFKWTAKCEQAFNDLKQRFTTAPILAHFDPNLKCVVKTDSSDYALSGVLSQYNKNGKLRLVAFLS
jgi:RNase H-like domain found in reverse transcriptase